MHTQYYNAHITINVRIHRFKLEALLLQRCFFPLPEVRAVWSWLPNQTPLSARSSFLLGQWVDDISNPETTKLNTINTKLCELINSKL